MSLTQRPGQTLLEMIIAIGVIMVSVFASTGLIISTIGIGRVSQNRVEAANFAREGIEVVRSIRDTNYLRRDQNVLECTPSLPDNTTNCFAAGKGDKGPIEWDDTGSTEDGYVALNGTSPTPTRYVAVNANGSWVLSPCLATCDFFNDQTYIKMQTIPSGGLLQNFFTQRVSASCSGCSQTRYSRIIDITKWANEETAPSVGPLEYLDITSTVQWRDRTGIKTLVAQQRLYDWR